MTSGRRVIFDKKESSAREKGCKKDTKMCPFAAPMISLKSVQVLEMHGGDDGIEPPPSAVTGHQRDVP